MSVYRETPPASRRATPYVSVVTLAVAVVATVWLDIIAPGPGPLIQPLNAFALTALAGPWKWIVEASALGVCLVALNASQRDADSPFVALLTVAGGSLAVSGGMVTDPWFPWERVPTPSGWVHIGAVLISMTAFSAAMVLRSRALPLRWHTTRDRWIERAFGGVATAAAVYAITLMLLGQPLPYFGFWERALLAIMVVWCASLAIGRRGPPLPTRSAAWRGREYPRGDHRRKPPADTRW